MKITFRKKIIEKDDDSYIITTIDEKLPHELFKQCLKKRLVTLIEDNDFLTPQRFWSWDEKKASEFFKSLGYTVISSEEVEKIEKRLEKEKEIRKNIAKYFFKDKRYFEEYIGGGYKHYIKVTDVISETETEIIAKEEDIEIREKAKVKKVRGKEIEAFYDSSSEREEDGEFIILEVGRKRYFTRNTN